MRPGATLAQGIRVRPRQPRRLPGVSYTGPCRYLLTFCTAHRQRLFVSDEAVDPVLWQIRRTARAQGFAILAYCFMPDHLHLLVEGATEAADLRRFARLAKQATAFAFIRRHGRRLWQRGYYERVLRRHDATLDVVRYVTRRVADRPAVAKDVDRIKEQAERIAQLVRHLLDLSRRESRTPENVDLGLIVDRVLALRERQIRRMNVEIVRSYGESVPRVEAIPELTASLLSFREFLAAGDAQGRATGGPPGCRWGRQTGLAGD